ncbi:MAG: DUF1929 domain-containing protein, partial [Actinobacteria bacterium]|nr:DUF1929 domain-containing protein [Actinomycetota bacterium]
PMQPPPGAQAVTRNIEVRPRSGWTAATPPGQGLPEFRWATNRGGYVDPDFARYNRTLFSWSSVLLPLLPEEGYRARVLVVGRTQPYWINLGDERPRWAPTAPRDLANRELAQPSAHRPIDVGGGQERRPATEPDSYNPQNVGNEPGMRQNCLSVLLPDGNVFVLGGSTTDPRWNAGLNSDAVRVAEMFNPFRNSWTNQATAEVARVYHAVALLLLDGRVWTAGSNIDSRLGEDNRELRMEVFEPWYWDQPRPRITAATSLLLPGQSFNVVAPDARSIRRVALVRAGSVTHGFNNDQRYVGLEFITRGSEQLSVIAPPNGKVAPPGHYMLFLINDRDVPSVGRFIRIVGESASIAAISTVPGETSLFVLGLDGRVWSNGFTPGPGITDWGGWRPIGDNTFPDHASISAISTTPRGSSIFVIGGDGFVWSNAYEPQSEGWGGWRRIGDKTFHQAAAVTALSTVPGGTSLFVVGPEGRIWANAYDPRLANPKWGGWAQIGENTFSQSAPITALSVITGGTGLYLMGLDGRVWSNGFTPGPGNTDWGGWRPIGDNRFPHFPFLD